MLDDTRYDILAVLKICVSGVQFSEVAKFIKVTKLYHSGYILKAIKK
jgi:hypothetical protein